MTTISFDRLEDYSHANWNRRKITCTFETRQVGYLQVEIMELDDGFQCRTLPQEPTMRGFLSNKEQRYIEQICRIVWRMVFEVPAMTERFE